jgi:hypothetical protein
MPGYSLFASVQVSHDYFCDGRGRDLRFRPHSATHAFLGRFDIRLLADGQGFRLAIDESQWPGIWSERTDDDGTPRLLRFDVHSADPYSICYTGSIDISPLAEGGDGEGASLLPVEPGVDAPLATIALALDPDAGEDVSAWTRGFGRNYRLHMYGRETVWKYLLTGDWRDRKLAVADQRGEMAFTAPVPERLPDGRSALVVRSASPILLQERPAQRFQLRDVTDSSERVLIQRLPGAVPRRLWREVIGGKPTMVSEIFVHS